MKVVFVRHRFGSVVGAATAVAVAATLVAAPPQHLRSEALAPQIHAIQLQAVTTSAVLNATDGGSATPSQAGPRANITAAATGAPNLLAVAAAVGLGAVVLPLWYLAAPVTLPMTLLIIAAFGGACPTCFSGSSVGASNPLANIILPGLKYWLTGPIQGIVGVISSAFAPPTAAATARRKAAGAVDVRRPRAAASAPARVSKSSAGKAEARSGVAAGKRAARSAK